MILAILDKNDKDAQIKFLKEALAEVKNKVNDLYTLYKYSDKVSNIIDFIDKRLIDVTY